MSKLEELIQELCPDGVEYKQLKDLGVFYGGLTGKSKDDFENGNKIFITYKNVYSNPSLDLHPDERVKIGETENQRTLEYGDVIFTGSSETPDECGISSVVTESPQDDLYLNSFCFIFRFNDLNGIYPPFMKHLFRSSSIRKQIGRTANGVTRYNVSKKLMAKISIPIPPLEVQEEIVRLLDDFTAKTAELQAELNKEYEARKKQYDCYKDMLIKQSLKQCNAAKLSNIASVYDGTHQTPEYKNEGVPFISVENIDDIYSSNKYITLDAFNKYKIKPQVNDVFMTRIGSIGKCSIMTRQENLAYYVSLALIRLDTSLIDPRYFKHYIESPLGKSELYKRTLHHAVPIKINKDDIGKITIKYPDLNTQKEITSILDNLDSMHNEFILTLKSEIESRQKQYEYFRDKLLTFKELN